jgi:hypothetical protein
MVPRGIKDGLAEFAKDRDDALDVSEGSGGQSPDDDGHSWARFELDGDQTCFALRLEEFAPLASSAKVAYAPFISWLTSRHRIYIRILSIHCTLRNLSHDKQ